MSVKLVATLAAGIGLGFAADAYYGPQKSRGGSSPPFVGQTGSANAAARSPQPPTSPPSPLGLSNNSSTPSSASLSSSKHASINALAVHIGLPSNDNVRVMEGYVASVNYERRIPNWVLERIPGGNLNPSGGGTTTTAVSRSESKFYSDESVPEMFRATNQDYSDKYGSSRGHLAAAQFHKLGTQNEMNETFNLSTNIVPQDMTLNACDWFRLETMTKKLAKQFPNSGLYVVTGPMFVPMYSATEPGKRVVSYEVIGERNVAVPTHLFKAFLGVGDDGRNEVAAFVLPNGPIADEAPLTTFQVPLSYIERVTGLQLFAGPGGLDSSRPHLAVDMCKRKKCDGSYGSFSKANRALGRIRAASTVKQAQSAFDEATKNGDADAAACERELKHKIAALKAKSLE